MSIQRPRLYRRCVAPTEAPEANQSFCPLQGLALTSVDRTAKGLITLARANCGIVNGSTASPPAGSACTERRRWLGRPDRKIVQDRAVRPISTSATTSQIFERLAHRAELPLLALHFPCPCERECLDLAARPVTVLPERDELRDLGNGKAEIARASDEAQHVNLAVAIVTVAGITPCGLRNEADRLIVADHSLADP